MHVRPNYIGSLQPVVRQMASDGLNKIQSQLIFNKSGLIPVIAQQHDTGEVLMLAWMNSEAIKETLETGNVCYWSRSRASLWRKGETSGHTQKLIELRIDCDGDSLLALVDQVGPACHTHRPSCFYKAIRADTAVIISDPIV